MQRRRWQRFQQQDSGVNLVPMIDILMTILIFFIILTMVMGNQQQIEVGLPTDRETPADGIDPPAPDPLVLTATEAGELTIDGRVVSEADAIAAATRQLAMPRAVVVVAAEPQATYDRVLKTMQQLQALDAERVVLAVDVAPTGTPAAP